MISYCSGSYFHKFLHFILYSNLPLTFLTATCECFHFGSISLHFFEINGGKLSVSPRVRFFFNVAHTYPYRSFVVFKQRTFFFLLSKLIILQKQRFSFLWKNRNIVLFVNSLQKRKAQESINKVSVELLIEQN